MSGSNDVIEGVIVPLLTPVDEEERVDEEALRSRKGSKLSRLGTVATARGYSEHVWALLDENGDRQADRIAG